MTQDRCLICGVRPVNRARCRCAQCSSQIRAEAARERRTAEANKPVMFVTYHDVTISLHRNGKGYAVKPCGRDVTKLPKSKLINLDGYVIGYTREQVKKLKAAVLGTLPQIPVMRD